MSAVDLRAALKRQGASVPGTGFVISSAKGGPPGWDQVMLGPLLGLGLTLASLMGFTINFYICAVVLVAKQVRMESCCATRILLAGLGFTGVFTAAIFLASNAMLHFNAEPIVPCQVSGTAFMFLHPMALYNIAGLNVDRYLAIAAPLHYSSLVQPKRVLLICFLTSTVTMALAVYPLTFTEYEYVPERISCRPNLRIPGGALYGIVYTLITFVIPVLIVAFCNIKISQIARHHRHRIARAIFEVTLSAQVTITHQKNPFLLSQGSSAARHPSATTTLLLIVVSVVILYTPIFMLNLFESTGVIVPDQYHLVGTALVILSTPYNAYLYGLKNKILRRAFRHYWRKKMTKNELDQEIQARTPSRRPSLTPQRVKQVGRPSSTGVIGLALPRTQSLRHSATSASLMMTKNTAESFPPKKKCKPTILVTKPGSEDDVAITLSERGRYKLGGSTSSVSGDSDVTQEDWGAPNWHLCASSTSLPVIIPSSDDRPLPLTIR